MDFKPIEIQKMKFVENKIAKKMEEFISKKIKYIEQKSI
jgi:hypothetical protein